MLTFLTKSQTLKNLEKHLRTAKILPQVSFQVGQLYEKEDSVNFDSTLFFNSIYSTVLKTLGDCEYIVRSSALSEDGENQSKAGQYLSVGNVSGEKALIEAIMEVAKAFDDDVKENQIFVQPMLKDIEMSGVLFTVDPNNGGNYFVINYDDVSGSTDSVTSGEGMHLKTRYIFYDSKVGNERFKKLCAMAKELMELFCANNLDIEFAMDQDTIYLLQVRLLVVKCKIAEVKLQQENLHRIFDFIKKAQEEKPYLYGNRTIYGVMPDWNPAEMIGLRPRNLALSLYKRLITDGTWAYQRNNYGYKNLRSFPLMVDLCGLPYIDTRVSFNSFIPKEIDSELSDKLANYYLNCLEKNPESHDKVEFEIIISCYTFDISKKLELLKENGFTEEECNKLRGALLDLTNHIINVQDGLWIEDTEKIQILEQHRERILNSNLDKVSKIYWLLEDCSRYGTLPFAGLARAGFIAVLLLKSLVNIGIITPQEYENYMGELNTVSSNMSKDWHELSERAFLKKYGHLRPGTYDILSSRYDADTKRYFGNKKSLKKERTKSFKLSLEQYEDIQSEMTKQGIQGDVLGLFKFIKAGIEGREYSKFVFTKSLSEALELIAELGQEYDIEREDMSYFDIYDLNEIYSSACDIKSALLQSIEKGKKKYQETLNLSLPPIIIKAEDVYDFEIPKSVPNYITLNKISGELIFENLNNQTIENKILLIPAADPGFDWIFSCSIAGFITAFGGANSHMAIRAGELGIPAVIGVGEKTFEDLKQNKFISIDCANKKVEILS